MFSNWQLFDTGNFMPHGMCYLWNPALLRLHFLSDLLIGVSYVGIALALTYFVRAAKRDLRFPWIFLGFGCFLMACAATHFMEIWTLWIPLYWLSGALKLGTAAVSVTVAIMLPPLLPKTLALLQSARASEQRKLDLEAANSSLRKEIAQRQAAEEKIRGFNVNLEELVRERTAQLAQASQNLKYLAATMEDSNNAVWTLNSEARITGWNAAAERLFGYRAEEVLGCPASMLALRGYPDALGEMMARLRRGEVLASEESVRRSKTGEALHLYLTLSPILNAAGEMAGASVVASDLTERRRAEDMLRMAVEAAPSAMIMVDAAGKIVLVNAQTEKLFGYQRQELIGSPVDALVPPKYRDVHPARRAEYMRDPQARPLGPGRELYAVRKDGSEFPVQIGLSPIKTDRGILVLSAVVDITERRQADTEIRLLHQELENRVAQRTAELTAVNAELEAFSYSVAHDLRAPIRQIAGFSKILGEECGAELSDDSKRYLRRIQEGSLHMGNLVDDLLLLAKFSRRALSRSPTSLNEILDAVLENLKPEWAGREILWQIDPLGTANCDAGLIEQVFVNLISNAIKFTRRRVSAEIHVGQTSVNGETVFFVRDNGAGFDPAYAGRLFGVFQRFHKAEEFEGTGVGLANVQRIVRKHGGRIWAEAEPEKGACFFLTLPDTPPERP